MVKPLFEGSLKIFTGEYGKWRNLGKDNRSSITTENYNWANLSTPEGEVHSWDIENEIMEDSNLLGNKKSRRGAYGHDLTESDWPYNI